MPVLPERPRLPRHVAVQLQALNGEPGLLEGLPEQLPVERITQENFKRLRVGMTEPQVLELLGKSNSTNKLDATVTRAWGRSARLWVSINGKGLVFNPGAEEFNAVSLPTGFQFPVPGPVKR